jgi:hypothetical protein
MPPTGAPCLAPQLARRRQPPVFLSRTPGPPPFSAMNSTPADSSAARIADTVLSRGAVSAPSIRASVRSVVPAAVASWPRLHPTNARAARSWAGCMSVFMTFQLVVS